MTDAELDHYWELAKETLGFYPKPGRRRYGQNPQRYYYGPGEADAIRNEFDALVRDDEDRAEEETRVWAEAEKAAVQARIEAKAAAVAAWRNDPERIDKERKRAFMAVGGAVYVATLITLIGVFSGTVQAILLVGGALSVAGGLAAFALTAEWPDSFSGYTSARNADQWPHRPGSLLDTVFWIGMFCYSPPAAVGVILWERYWGDSNSGIGHGSGDPGFTKDPGFAYDPGFYKDPAVRNDRAIYG